jgi:hypothetical protein
MSIGLTDTDKSAEQTQIRLFRQASTGKKLSLLRSLSRTTIELSRRAIMRSPSEMPIELHFIGLVYSPELANRIFLRWPLFKGEGRMKSPPDLLDALTPIIDIFEQLQVSYFLGGSIASSAHGVPRATADVDLVAALRDEQVKTLVDQLQNDYYIDESSIRRAITRHSSFNLIHLATMLKVDIFIPKDDPYDQEVSRRAVVQPLDEGQDARKFLLASAEDVIIAKLDWFRRGGEVSEKQWGDILGILRVQGQNLDFDYLKRWVDQKSLGKLLQRAIDEAGDTRS